MQCTQIYLTLSLRFNRHFPCGPGLVDIMIPDFIGAKDDCGGEW